MIRYDQPYVQNEEGVIVNKLIPECLAAYEGLTENKLLNFLVKIGLLKREYRYYDRWDRLRLYRSRLKNKDYGNEFKTDEKFDVNHIETILLTKEMQTENEYSVYFKYRVDRLLNIASIPIGVCEYKLKWIKLLNNPFCYPFSCI